MSRINVDSSALRDPRFVRLARLLGLPGGRHEARGRVEEVWWLCTDRESYTISPIDLVIAMELEDEASTTQALLEADLAEWSEHELIVGDDYTPSPGREGRCLYMKGTVGRIEWLAKKRRSGSKGGQSKGKEAPKRKGSSASSKTGGSASSKTDVRLPPPAPAPAPAKRSLPSEAIQLAGRLAQLVLERDPKNQHAKKGADAWADPIRLLHERDGRSWDEIREVLEWSQQDPFWRQNILSGDKLRKQFPALVQRMSAGRPKQQPRLDLAARLAAANAEGGR